MSLYQPEIEYLLKTTAETLLNWLREEIIHDWEFGIARVWKHSPPWDIYRSHRVLLYMDCPTSHLASGVIFQAEFYEPFSDPTSDSLVLEDAAQLTIHERPPDHIKVVGRCRDVPEVAAYFGRFWAAMVDEFGERPLAPAIRFR